MLSNLFRLTWVLVAIAALASTACDDEEAPESDPTIPASSQEPTTGNAQLDAASDYLRNHNIDGLMGMVEMTPLGCASTPEIGGPPTCVPGSEGASVDTFAVGQCEGAYVTSLEAVRQTLVDALGSGDSSIYAVIETQASIPRDDGFWVVLNESAQPSGSEDATVWQFDREANLVGLLLGCTSRHAADRVEELFPQGRFLLGPEG